MPYMISYTEIHLKLQFYIKKKYHIFIFIEGLRYANDYTMLQYGTVAHLAFLLFRRSHSI